MPPTEAEESKVKNWQRQVWKTNFKIKSVDLREINQAAAARDVISPIDEPSTSPSPKGTSSWMTASPAPCSSTPD